MFKFAKAASTAALAGGLVAAMSATAFAADIEGTWRTKSGEKAKIAKCGSSYCVTLTTGQYAGKRIGKMSGSGSNYKGSITDPVKDKKYNGKAKVSGNSLSMSGCVLGGLICQSQKWTRL
ncbi:MAG: DUF2147 domain-containing protein [Pseudomonadota bacterium]